MKFKTKYIWLAALCLTFASCSDDDNSNDNETVLPPLTAGEADFSNYVSLGNSLTAGYTDGALFAAGQQNSMSSMLAQQFSLAGGGSFSQPMMSDNTGGVLLGGNQILKNRLVFNGEGPVRLEEVIGPVSPQTDLLVNNPTGPFNNMGVPGAKSYHLLANGYGNIGNLSLGLANPYFVRMTGSTPDASVIELSMAQNPTFFTLWIGNNDVLGYATTGGDGTDPITDQATFDYAYTTLVSALTAGGAKGVVANIPDVTTIPHFTTVPYNPLDPSNPDYGPQIPTLNATFGALNQAFAFLGVPERSIVFSETDASPVVIHDESIPNISAQLIPVLMGAGLDPQTAGLLGTQYGQCRQATAQDLLVLSSSSEIGQLNMDYFNALVSGGVPPTTAGQLAVNGITYPMLDKWVLLPSEQNEIANAIAGFNATIQSAAQQTGLAFVDANGLMNQIANGGIQSGDFILTSDLVLGGAFSLDGVHPTARGYSTIANEFLKAIDVTYGSNFEASGSMLDAGDYPTNYSPLMP